MTKQLKIIDFDEKGRGMGDGLHIPFTYPGDIVEAELVNKQKESGRLISIIKSSPHRQEAPCEYFGVCGGCPWQGLKYSSQLQFKEKRIRELFGDSSSIIPSPDEYFYRNRMDFAFGPNFSIGLKDNKDNIIDIEKCWLMSDASNKILGQVRQFVAQNKLEHHWAGMMRHIVIREGENIKNIIVNIITSDKSVFPLEELWEKLKDSINGVSWSINLSPADRSYGDIQNTFGADHLMESLNGLKFKVPIQSFFQTNTRQAENLLKIISNFSDLQGNETILDLYAGTGSIGLSLAGKANKVFGVEENQPAVELSLHNAKLNNIKNYSAIAGRVEQIIGDLCEEYDLVILDPPRPGVSKRVLRKLCDKRPKRIIYVSCNPFTQKHDVQMLKEYGYKIGSCQPLDMFPHTPHIENVILLSG